MEEEKAAFVKVRVEDNQKKSRIVEKVKSNRATPQVVVLVGEATTCGVARLLVVLY